MDEFELDPSLPWYKAMIAGASAGVAEHTIMFPVDTIKTRMQAVSPVGTHSYTSVVDVVVRISREEGILRLYRGVGAVILGAIPSHAINYATYEFCKEKFGGNTDAHTPTAHALAGACATLAHDAVITPLDVVKQRLQIQHSPYSGVIQCARSIFVSEGLIAFYAAYPTTVLMNAPFMAVQFSGYEAFKRIISKATKDVEHSAVLDETVAGGAAGALAGFVSTPFDVVKTRLQTQIVSEQSIRRGAFEIIRTIWRSEGVRGFWRGASARVIYFAPTAAICWSTYESVKRLLMET